MTKPGLEAWKSSALAKTYVEEVRMGIPLAAEQIDVMLRLVAAKDEPVSSFLDLGCGNGILAASLLDSHPKARGVLVDFSAPMLDAARESLSSHAASMTFAELDYGDPSWSEAVSEHGPFDVVVSGFSIHHQTDVRKRGLYAEIFDLLGADGLFVNIEHVASANAWVRERFDDYCIDSLHTTHVNGGGTRTREDIAAEFYHVRIRLPIFSLWSKTNAPGCVRPVSRMSTAISRSWSWPSSADDARRRALTRSPVQLCCGRLPPKIAIGSWRC